MGQMTAAIRQAFTSPESFPDQDLGWGDQETARSRLARHGDAVEVQRRTLIIDPEVRAAAGTQDFAERYLTGRLQGTEFAAVRAEITARHAGPDGKPRADYLLVMGRRG